VNDNPNQAGILSRLIAVRQIFGEAVLVAALGAAFAFAANQISPLGLALTRDYFPAGTAHSVRPVVGNGSPHTGGTNSDILSPAQFLAAQMKEKDAAVQDLKERLERLEKLVSNPPSSQH